MSSGARSHHVQSLSVGISPSCRVTSLRHMTIPVTSQQQQQRRTSVYSDSVCIIRASSLLRIYFSFFSISLFHLLHNDEAASARRLQLALVIASSKCTRYFFGHCSIHSNYKALSNVTACILVPRFHTRVFCHCVSIPTFSIAPRNKAEETYRRCEGRQRRNDRFGLAIECRQLTTSRPMFLTSGNN